MLLTISMSAGTLQDAQDLYASKDYVGALKLYENLLQKYPRDAKLNYNAGTTAIRMQDFGRAVLYLERALKLDPSLDDASVNLAIAKKKIGPKIIDEHPTIWSRMWKRFYSTFDSNMWLVAFMALSLSLLAVQFWRKKLRRTQYLGYTYILLTLAILSLAASYSIYRGTHTHSTGIVMLESPAYKDPELSRKMTITLEPGQKFKVLSQGEKEIFVQLPNGMQTYISSTSVERI